MRRPSCVPCRLLLPGLDGRDLDLGVLLAVALPHPVAGLVLVLEDVDLRGLDLGDDLTGDLHALEDPRVGGDLVTVHHEQVLEVDGAAGLADDPVDLDDVADGDLVLPAATADDRVHDLPLPARVGARVSIWPARNYLLAAAERAGTGR